MAILQQFVAFLNYGYGKSIFSDDIPLQLIKKICLLKIMGCKCHVIQSISQKNIQLKKII